MVDPQHADMLFEPLDRGLAKAGRTRADIDIAAAVALAVDDDVSAARDAVRPWLAFYLGAMGSREKNFYVELAERAGPRPGGARVPGRDAVRPPRGRRRGADRRARRRDGASRPRPPGSTTGSPRSRRAGVNTLVAVPLSSDRPGLVRMLAEAFGGLSGPPGSPAPSSPARGRSARTRPACASSCASSPACRCSARCSASRPAARRCGSSCATAPARCRARCGGEDFEALGIGPLADGVQVVAAGGCDYYPGSRTASPSFSFAVTDVRVAGEGDLLAQLERLRRALHAEGLFEPQKRLPRPHAAAHDRRRLRRERQGARRRAGRRCAAAAGAGGWCGRSRPVQDRHAAPAITRALQDLAACAAVERDRGRPRRRLARGPVRVLRRDAVPHGRAAARAGDLVGRPPHRPHAARRRRGGRLLDADARRRGRRAARLHRRPRRAGGHGGPARAPGPPRDRRPRPHAGAPLARARRPRRRATALACTSSCASCGRRRRRAASADGERAQPHGAPRALAAQAPAPPRRAPSARRRCDAPRDRARRPRSRSGRWSAATRSSRRRPASRSPRPPPRASSSRLTLRLHDGRVPVRPEPPVP